METESPALRCRLRTLLAQKLWMALGLNLLVCIPYFGLQHFVLRPVNWILASALERAIPFSPAAVWLYQSLYLLMPVAPMLMIHAGQLRRYALGMASMSLGANVVFLAFPTAVVRPEAAGAGAVYRTLVRYDAPLHAFPSLHAAFAVFSALCCTAVFSRDAAGARLVRRSVAVGAGDPLRDAGDEAACGGRSRRRGAARQARVAARFVAPSLT